MTTDLEAIDSYKLLDCILSLVTNLGYLSPDFKRTIYNIERANEGDLFVIDTKQSVCFRYSVKENRIMICYSSRIVFEYCYKTDAGGWRAHTNKKLAFVIQATIENLQNEYDRLIQAHLEQALNLDESQDPQIDEQDIKFEEDLFRTEVEYTKRRYFSRFAGWSWFAGGLALLPYSAFFSLMSIVVGIIYISKSRNEEATLLRLKEASDDNNEKQILALEGIIKG